MNRAPHVLSWSTFVLLAWVGAAPVSAQGSGSVEGVVTVLTRPVRRSTARYPGAATNIHSIQRVPAVVFIEGPIPGAPARPPAAPPVMVQRDTAFVPAALAIPVGTTVSFPNGDPFFHNVFSYSSSARFDLGRYPRGEAKEVTFDEPGLVKVYCEVHEFMRAIILVSENPFSAVVDERGHFRLEGIPAGTYTVVAWHPDMEPVEREVRVTAGGTARLDVELR